MKRIGILGDIGSGKTFVAKCFGHPVFNADQEVANLYKKDKKILLKLRKVLPEYFNTSLIDKENIAKAILDKKYNLKKIIKIVHIEIRKKLNFFLRKNKNKKIVILDIPLLLENKINKKNDILIFVKSKRSEVLKRLKKRKNYNYKLMKKFRNIQLPLDFKKKKSHFVIYNNFNKKSIKKYVKDILQKI
tara:strand:- start:64 stop:630 length:567 start_codon:yes stop_codon:yes gene_type:complete